MHASETLDEVLKELGSYITEEVAATQIAITCLRTVAYSAFEAFNASQSHDETRLLGAGVPSGGWVTPVHGLVGAQALVARMEEGGDTHRRLTQQLIVTLYTAWDAEFRQRIAAAHGVRQQVVQVDFFGDLRHLRNDIVHHRGTATRENSAKCETILNRRLADNEPIYLRDDELRYMHLQVPWSKLATSPGP